MARIRIVRKPMNPSKQNISNRVISPHLTQSINIHDTQQQNQMNVRNNSESESDFGTRRVLIDTHNCKHVYYLKNGEINGLYELYYPNGELRRSIMYNNGFIDGIYMCWWRNGKIHINCNYKNGELHGQYCEYNENGALIVKYNAVYGILNGPYYEYHGNGKLMHLCNYKNDIISGVSYDLYETGHLRHFAYYLNGVILSETSYKEEDAIDIYDIAYRPLVPAGENMTL